MPINTEAIEKQIKTHYRDNSLITRIFYPEEPLPLKDSFIQLGLFEEAESDTKTRGDKPSGQDKGNLVEDEEALARDSFLHYHQKLASATKQFRVDELLAQSKASLPVIAIEGMPGTGKSTLCQYIAYQWSQDNSPWNQFEWVFHLRLRDIKPEHTTLGEAIADNCLNALRPFKPELLAFIQQQFEEQPHKILLLLDGLDELSLKESPVWRDLVRLACLKIITSRPGYRARMAEMKPNMKCIVWGFNEEQIKHYLHFFFTHTENPEEETKCLSLLKGNANLWSLAHIPIQCELLASLWQDLALVQNLSDMNQTELYAFIVGSVLKWHCLRQGNEIEGLSTKAIEAQYSSYLAYLEYVAFLGMASRQIILKESVIKKAEILSAKMPPDYPEVLKQIGLVKVSSPHSLRTNALEFVHLTFQEYFAARFIARNFLAFYESEPMAITWPELFEFIQKNKWEDFYTVTFRFTSGLLAKTFEDKQLMLSQHKAKPESTLTLFQLWFDALLQAPRSEHEVIELLVLANHLEEAKLPDIHQLSTIIAQYQIWSERFFKDKKLPNTYKERFLGSLSINHRLFKEINFFEVLLSCLKDYDWEAEASAAKAVGSLGSQLSASHLEALLALLKYEHKGVQYFAAEAVGSLGPQLSATHLEALLMLMKDDDNDVRIYAAYAVSKLGLQLSASHLEALLALLKDYDSEVRSSAAYAVSKLGPQLSASHLEALLALLKDGDSRVRASAAKAAGSLGPQLSALHLEALLALLKDDDSGVRISAAEAVGSLGPQLNALHLEALLALLKDDDSDVRDSAADAISSLGPQLNASHLEALLALLKDDDSDVRDSAADAISSLGPQLSALHLEALLALLKDDDSGVRRSAAEAVSSLGPQLGASHLDALLALLKDDNSEVREATVRAVSALGAYLRGNVIDSLILLAKNKEGKHGREAALSVIGHLANHNKMCLKIYLEVRYGESLRVAPLYRLSSDLGSSVLEESYTTMMTCIERPHDRSYASTTHESVVLAPEEEAVSQGGAFVGAVKGASVIIKKVENIHEQYEVDVDSFVALSQQGFFNNPNASSASSDPLIGEAGQGAKVDVGSHSSIRRKFIIKKT